jgi:hypothetical protein
MKNVWKVLLIIAVLCLCGCASQGGTDYASKAKEQEFSYFFPQPFFVRSFATLEEAYDYIKTAQVKFASAAGKPRVKGLVGKLIGPPVSGENPVTVFCGLNAQDAKSASIDLTDTSKPMEESIKKAISSLEIFMVFYGDRGIVIPNFFLDSGYQYSSGNTQFQQFSFNNNTYDTDYPVGWNIEKGFGFLRKEIN